MISSLYLPLILTSINFCGRNPNFFSSTFHPYFLSFFPFTLPFSHFPFPLLSTSLPFSPLPINFKGKKIKPFVSFSFTTFIHFPFITFPFPLFPLLPLLPFPIPSPTWFSSPINLWGRTFFVCPRIFFNFINCQYLRKCSLYLRK